MLLIQHMAALPDDMSLLFYYWLCFGSHLTLLSRIFKTNKGYCYE